MADTVGQDARFMRAALALGRRSMGRAAPNPSVGALVVKDGVVLGRGVTAPGGRPHAEPLALAQAGIAARGATLYVTLEPCSHHGRSPPCADAVIAAGIGRVVAALRDPDERVAGQGFARLRAAGIDVVENVEEAQARRDHIGHIRRATAGRPSVTVKMAETLDGFAAAAPRQPRLLITGPSANAQVQMLRATHDAIMIGRGTAAADDPLLTVRLPGMAQIRSTRIVMDSTLSLRLDSRIVETAAEVPAFVLAGPDASAARDQDLTARGVAVSRIQAKGGRLDLAAALAELGARGFTRVLCEGGPTLASALILAGLADRVVLLTAHRLLGQAGGAVLTADARSRIEDPAYYELQSDMAFGADRMRVYELAEAACLPD